MIIASLFRDMYMIIGRKQMMESPRRHRRARRVRLAESWQHICSAKPGAAEASTTDPNSWGIVTTLSDEFDIYRENRVTGCICHIIFHVRVIMILST
jgi:hypothetical protein